MRIYTKQICKVQIYYKIDYLGTIFVTFTFSYGRVYSEKDDNLKEITSICIVPVVTRLFLFLINNFAKSHSCPSVSIYTLTWKKICRELTLSAKVVWCLSLRVGYSVRSSHPRKTQHPSKLWKRGSDFCLMRRTS